jgi:hypothetical protein
MRTRHPSLPGPGRDLEDPDRGVDPAGKGFAPRDIEIDMRQQIDLVEEHQIGMVKHGRVFQRFVLSLGHTQHHHFVMLAEIEGRGADQVTDVLDKQDIQTGKIEVFHGMGDHMGVEMAARSGIDLFDRHPGSGDARRIVIGLLIPLDHGKTVDIP